MKLKQPNHALRHYCSDLYYTALKEEKDLNNIPLLKVKGVKSVERMHEIEAA